MSAAHATSGRPALAAALAFPVLLAACRLETTPHGGLAESQGLSVVGSELRIRVRALVGPYTAAIEESADAAARRCGAAVRVRALEWKLGAIPQAQDALLQPDPLVALLDGWGYAAQMQRYLAGPGGRAAMGDCSAEAAAAMGRLCARAKEIVEELAPGRSDEVAALVEQWTDRHPLRELYLPRQTMAPALAKGSARAELGALGAVGTAVESLDDLTARLAAYRESLLKEATWTAELAAARAGASELASQAARDAERITAGVERLGALAAAIPALAARERAAALEAVRAERAAVLADIDAQRRQTLALLQAERAVVLDRVDAMGRAAIAEGTARVEDVVDRVFLRIAQLVAALLVVAALAALVILRVLGARGRSRPASSATGGR